MLFPGMKVTVEEVRSIQAYKVALLSIKKEIEGMTSNIDGKYDDDALTVAEKKILNIVKAALQNAI
jgi:hypothetical protein